MQLHKLQAVSRKVNLSKTQFSNRKNRANQLVIQMYFSLCLGDPKHHTWSIRFTDFPLIGTKIQGELH